MASQTSETSEIGAAEHLEDALDDLNMARQSAQEEMRSRIDSAISRAREALDDLGSDAEERAESLRKRAKDQTADWQRTLEDATEDARRELGIRAIHAQRTEDALEVLAKEIKQQKRSITT